MLLHMYQIFSSLRGHLHFSVQFSLHFHGNFFLNNPLSDLQTFFRANMVQRLDFAANEFNFF